MNEFARHAIKASEIVGKVLDGVEIPEQQRKTALQVLNGDVKERQAMSGKAARVIGLVRHVRAPETREEIALRALEELLPGSTRERLGGVPEFGGARGALPAAT